MKTIKQNGVFGLALLVGTGGLAASSFAAIDKPDPSVVVFDQTLKSNSVMVDYAYLPQNGYVAVYSSGDDGKPAGTPIGHVNLEAGDHRQIKVTLNEPPKAGDRLWVSLYKDGDGKPTLDLKAGDAAIWEREQMPPPNAFLVR